MVYSNAEDLKKKSVHNPGNNHTITSNLWNIFLKAESPMVMNCHIPSSGALFWYPPVVKYLITTKLKRSKQTHDTIHWLHHTLDVIIIWFQGPWATQKKEGIIRILNKHFWKDVAEINMFAETRLNLPPCSVCLLEQRTTLTQIMV